jgi:hypothetical protein
MIFLLLILNFGISWLNAWGCGRSWPETKHEGGWAHFMNWMGAIMAACGFTWCLLVLLAFVGNAIPYDSTDPKHVAYVISPEMLRAMLELGYLVIIGPVIGSGLAITANSWAHFYRRRSFGSGAVAAYNTYAQAYNMYEAVSAVPEILGDLTGLFGGKKSSSSSSSDDDVEHKLAGGAILVIIVLVIFALIGGILLTRMIILTTSRNYMLRRRLQFEFQGAD